MITGIVILSVMAIVIVWVISIYNTLITLRNRYKNAYSQIDVQLKRRYDLIPNLVETAKGYIKHERETLETVIKARNQAMTANAAAAANPADAAALKGVMGAETILTGAMSKFMMLTEAYPDLKANQNMMQLSEELTSTENKISFARQGFNDAVTVYNNGREVFPNVMVANNFGFKEAQLWEISESKEREAVKVSF